MSRLTDAKLFTMPFGCANARIYAWLRGNLICLRFISARQAGREFSNVVQFVVVPLTWLHKVRGSISRQTICSSHKQALTTVKKNFLKHIETKVKEFELFYCRIFSKVLYLWLHVQLVLILTPLSFFFFLEWMASSMGIRGWGGGEVFVVDWMWQVTLLKPPGRPRKEPIF